jgi:U3 small nucleolar RNA-associated protein 18
VSGGGGAAWLQWKQGVPHKPHISNLIVCCLAVLAGAVAAVIVQVDGLRNPLVQSLFLQDCPIHTAAFAAGGSKVVAAGRRPFYYIADMHTAQLERVVTPPSIHQQGQVSSTQQQPQAQQQRKGGKSSSGATGGRTGMKSCESFAASSDPAKPLLAFLGDGGHIGLVSLGSRRPVGSLKMNGSARAAVFSSDGNTLITAGEQCVICVCTGAWMELL